MMMYVWSSRRNLFYGNGLPETIKESVYNVKENGSAIVFGYYVNDPKRYGVIEFDDSGRAISIEEKPTKPMSNYAIAGLYFHRRNGGLNENVKIKNHLLVGSWRLQM